MTIEERDGKKGMEIRIVYGSPMGDTFGVAATKEVSSGVVIFFKFTRSLPAESLREYMQI